MPDELVAAARSGDESAFTALVEPHRRELRVHCYRMLGSFDEAEDLVQETFLKAWQGVAGFAGRSSFRAWLYRIATNACLDALDGRARRVLPQHLGPPSDPGTPQAPRTDIPWLQPFPGHLWEPAAPAETQPDAEAVARETIELAFLAAIQHLPPRQRAVLLLRDVLGWPAKDAADLLDTSVASANSALQRARATMRDQLPPSRADWAPTPPTDAERAVLRRYLAAVSGGDLAGVADLLAEDVRTTMPPFPLWFAGRAAVLGALAASWDPALPAYVGRLHLVPVTANGRLAAAAYALRPGDPKYRPFAISVAGFEHGRIAELTAFHDTALFPAFGLPMSFPADGRLNEGPPS